MSKALGRLWVVAAPSGGGKTSLVEAVVIKLPQVVRSISFTTREQRPGEVYGKDYCFIDEKTFQTYVERDVMLEHEKVFEHHYGTSRVFIETHLEKGCDVILTIDWQGSRRVRQMMPESKGIFILPPTLSVLEKRLLNRDQDKPEVVAKRMADARDQASHYNEFDFLIVNDDFERALDELMTIIKADRLSRDRQEKIQRKLIQNLLSEP